MPNQTIRISWKRWATYLIFPQHWLPVATKKRSLFRQKTQFFADMPRRPWNVYAWADFNISWWWQWWANLRTAAFFTHSWTHAIQRYIRHIMYSKPFVEVKGYYTLQVLAGKTNNPLRIPRGASTNREFVQKQYARLRDIQRNVALNKPWGWTLRRYFRRSDLRKSSQI